LRYRKYTNISGCFFNSNSSGIVAYNNNNINVNQILNRHDSFKCCISGKFARSFSTSKIDDNDNKEIEKWDIIYEGLMAGPLKRIKTVSITTCTLSMITMPLLVLYGNQDVAVTGRLAVAFTAGVFGVGTTAVVHFIGKTYVGKLWKKIKVSVDDDGNEIELDTLEDDDDEYYDDEDEDDEEEDYHLKAETYNLFGRKKQIEFYLSEIEEGDPRPFSSFKVHGLNFFLHHEQDAWYEGEDGRIDELFTRPIESAEDEMIEAEEEEVAIEEKDSNKPVQ